MEHVASEPADGYTLLVGTATGVITPHVVGVVTASLSEVVPQIEAGKVRIFAMAAPPAFPPTPTCLP